MKFPDEIPDFERRRYLRFSRSFDGEWKLLSSPRELLFRGKKKKKQLPGLPMEAKPHVKSAEHFKIMLRNLPSLRINSMPGKTSRRLTAVGILHTLSCLLSPLRNYRNILTGGPLVREPHDVALGWFHQGNKNGWNHQKLLRGWITKKNVTVFIR